MGALHSLFFLEVCIISYQDLMINDEIRDREVRLIDEDGSQLGVVELATAQRIAEERSLDLVKIAPQGNPAGLQDHGLRKIPL